MIRTFTARRRALSIASSLLVLALTFTPGCGSSNSRSPSLASDTSSGGGGLGNFNFPTSPGTPGVSTGTGSGSTDPTSTSGPAGATGLGPSISGMDGQEPPELSSTIAGATSPESLRTPAGLTAFLQQNFQRITGRPYGASLADYFNQLALNTPVLQDALEQLYCEGQYSNPYRAFVRGLYENTLLRYPAPSEVEYHTNRLFAGVSRQQVARDFLNSPEFRKRLIQSYYVRYLGRFAEQAGEDFWLGQLNAGMTVEEFQAQILSSAEFYNRNGANLGQFVNALYAYQLGRPAEPSGWQFWVGWIQARGGSDNQNTRLLAGREFVKSEENRNNVVAWLYVNYLGRPPEAAGYAYWVPFLLNNGVIETAAGILGSDEYYNRQVFRGINWVNQLCN